MRTINYLYLLAFIGIACVAFSVSADNAVADTHTWDGGGADNLASNKINWICTTNSTNDIAPITGDNIVFNAAVSTKACTLDVSMTYGDITLTGAGGGVVTQGAVDIGYGDFTMGGWTWTGVATNKQTCSGDISISGGTYTSDKVNLIKMGEGKTITINSAFNFYSLRFSASTIYNNSCSVSGLTIDAGKEVSITTTNTLNHRAYNGAAYFITNNGIINGAGTFKSILYDADRTLTLGVINCQVSLSGSVASTANRILTLGANTVLGSSLTIGSAHATNTVTLATSTYTLTCGALTLDTRGCLTQSGTGGNVVCTSYTQSGTGSVLTGKVDATFTCSGDYSFTVGTMTAMTVRLEMTGISKSLALKSEAYLHSLKVSGTCTYTGAGTIYIPYIIEVTGTLTIASAKTIRIGYEANKDPTFINTGTINGLGTLEYTLATYDKSISLGIINCPILLTSRGNTANRVFTLESSAIIGNTITINSYQTTYTTTLDLNGKSLSTSGPITASTRGIIRSSVPGAAIFGNYSEINGGDIDWTNIWWNPLAPAITRLTDTPGLGELEAYSSTYSATSNGTVTWSLFNAPTWMTVNATGVVSGTPGVNDQGNNTFTVVATNAIGSTNYDSYVWVQDLYYGSETTDTMILLMLTFFAFVTIINIVGYVKKIGILQLMAILLILAGSLADMTLWNTLPILPIAFVVVNIGLVVGFIGRR